MNKMMALLRLQILMCIHHPHFLHACIRTCSFVVVDYNRRYCSCHLGVKLRTFSCGRDTRCGSGLVGTWISFQFVYLNTLRARFPIMWRSICGRCECWITSGRHTYYFTRLTGGGVLTSMNIWSRYSVHFNARSVMINKPFANFGPSQ